MSNVLFRMVKGEDKAHFQSSEATPEVQLALVKGMFAAMGVQEPTPMIIKAEPISPFGEPTAPFAVEVNEECLKEKQRQEVEAAKAQVAAAAMTVVKEKVDDNRMGTSIAERLQAKQEDRRPKWQDSDVQFVKKELIKPEDHITLDLDDDNEEFDDETHYVCEDKVNVAEGDEVPMHFKTGFKIDTEGRKLYKLRYWCPRCDYKGNHYIPENTAIVDCHNCTNGMPVHKAVPRTIFLEPDAFKNWYIAGKQQPVKVLSKAKYDKLMKRRGR